MRSGDLQLKDIATKNVIHISSDAPLSECIALMYRHNIHDMVVQDGAEYKIITIADLLHSKAIENHSLKLKELPLKPLLSAPESFFVHDVIEQFGLDFDYIVLTNEEGKLSGIVSKTDIVANYDPKALAQHIRLIDLIPAKHIHYITPQMPTKEGIELLDNDIEAALIIIDKKRAKGIFTPYDTLKLLALGADLNRPISEYMSSPLKTLPQEATVADAFEFLQKNRFKRVIVTNNEGEVVGVMNQTQILQLLHNKWLEMVRTHANKIDSLQKKAHIDPLTGAYNRYKLDETIRQEEKRLSRNTNLPPYSIIICDIDDFKKINDSYGHLLGDEILKAFANRIKSNIREYDMLFRWGGEEFVIFLPQTSCKEAIKVAHKLQKIIEQNPINDIAVTCSFGVSGKKDRKEEINEIFKRADEALYKAKKSGKNCVVSEC